MLNSIADNRNFRERLIEQCTCVLKAWSGRPLIAAYFYGSALTSRFRSDSDMDIALLDFDSDRLNSREQAILMDQLERSTGRPVDLRMLRDGAPSYQAHVLKEGIPLWLHDPGALEEFTRQVSVSADALHAENDRSWPAVLKELAAQSEGHR